VLSSARVLDRVVPSAQDALAARREPAVVASLEARHDAA
jgi:hypothetical protein